jgi:methylenetetrahydrofolate dehydrogenase (NADP+)/methenyltetrahydrofolate cyclohydrolase
MPDNVVAVPATLMQGAALAARIREQVAADVAAFGPVGLATVLAGDDPASHVYVTRKHDAARAAGVASVDRRLPANVEQEELLALLEELNADEGVDGILVQLPLPDHIDEGLVLNAVDPAKDVDGFHPVNRGLLSLGRARFVPATPLGIMTLLAEYGVPLEGAHAVVVGRSEIVGKPTALLLLAANATVTVCHSRTRDLGRMTRDADVLVVAVGRPGIVTADMVKEGAAVVDVGINRTEAGLVGDVDPGVAEPAGYLTPVPGGVGPMTIAMLLRNTVHAAQNRRSALASPP